MKIFKMLLFFLKRWRLFTSLIMKIFLRMTGAKIGKNVYISISSKILGNKITIGNDSKILEKVKIKGNEINIGSGVIISANSLITGKSNLSIGNTSYLGKKSRIDLSRDVTIGKDVGFGENSVIWTHGYFPPYDEGYPVTYSPVLIDDGAWVSTNIIVLPGVSIGKNVIVGAGSVITKNVDNGYIIAGNPAKVIKKTQSILHNKSFTESMAKILSDFNKDKIIEIINKEKTLEIKYTDYSVFVIENDSIEINEINKNKKNIVFTKDCSNEFLYNINVSCFDFNKRTSTRSKYKHIKRIRDHLRNFGVRYLIS